MADVTEVKATPLEIKATPATVGGVSSSEEKQGTICCGCCCDFRRAVMVVAIIGICFQTLTLILALAGSTALAVGSANAEDDEVAAVTAAGAAASGVFVAFAAVGLCFHIFQLFAALKYNVCMLATVVVFELVYMGVSLWNSYTVAEENGTSFVGDAIITIVIQCLFIYPVVGLIMEIKNGIMSAETYPREAHSCCCEPKV